MSDTQAALYFALTAHMYIATSLPRPWGMLPAATFLVFAAIICFKRKP